MTGRPFKARFGFNASGKRGEQFNDPRKLSDPLGEQDVVNRRYFWEHANYLKLAARIGDLPNPMTDEIVEGESYLIKYDTGGKELTRLATWDKSLVGPARDVMPAGVIGPTTQLKDVTDPLAVDTEFGAFLDPISVGALTAGEYMTNNTGAAAVMPIGSLAAGLSVPNGSSLVYMGDDRLGTNGFGILTPPATNIPHTGAAKRGVSSGNWRFGNAHQWVKDLIADPDQVTDQKDGDAQYTIEKDKEQVKIWFNGAWHTIYDWQKVLTAIASLSLFEGTFQQEGGGVVGAIEWDKLPDLTVIDQLTVLSKAAHYWTWVSDSGFVLEDEYRTIGLTGGVDGVYNNVPVTGGTGTGAELQVRVQGGIGFISMLKKGTGYTDGDTLTIAAGALGTGSSQTTFVFPHVANPPAPNGLSRDLAGSIWQPGDWAQIANISGDPLNPQMVFQHIGGDLLSRGRWFGLGGLQPWRKGSWEKDSLVVFDKTIWRAAQGIVKGDLAPGPAAPAVSQISVIDVPTTGITTGDFLTFRLVEPGKLPVVITYTYQAIDTAETAATALQALIAADLNAGAIVTSAVDAAIPTSIRLSSVTPGVAFTVQVVAHLNAVEAQPAKPETGGPWQKVDIAGGVRWVLTDADLPASAKLGEIFFSIQSARAGGKGALYYWDNAAGQWQPLGGSGGTPLDLGAGKELIGYGVPVGTIVSWCRTNSPPGWFLCDGSTFPAGEYPELAAVLGSTQLPDLRGRFLRGWSTDNVQDVEGPRGPLTLQGQSTAVPTNPFRLGKDIYNTNIQSSWSGGQGVLSSYHGALDADYYTTTRGGDAETRPKNVAIVFIMKAYDSTTTTRA